MELELKHLAGYLPYGLKGIINGKVVQMCTMHQNSIQTFPAIRKFTWCAYGDFKPILRPLSDLTKEIEVNGNKFIPITELLRLSNFDVDKMEYKEQLEFLDSFNNTLFMTFDDGQKLLEWHFDIYGLIPKGLAIGINTLK